MIQTLDDRRRLAWALIAGAAVVSVMAGLDSIGKPLGRGFQEYRAAGTLGHANTLGAYLAALLPLAVGLAWGEIRGRRRWWVLLLLAGTISAMGIALLLTLSRAAGLSLVAGFLVAGQLWLTSRVGQSRRRRLTTVILCAFVLIAATAGILALGFDTGALHPSSVGQRLLSIADVSSLTFGDRERLSLLEAAWGMFSDHPILGVGSGNFHAHVSEYTSFRPAWRQEFPHNVVLHVAAETGVVGLAAFLWWAGSVLGSGYRVLKRCAQTNDHAMLALTLGAFAGVVSVMVGSLFGYPFVHGIWEPFIYCLALSVRPPAPRSTLN